MKTKPPRGRQGLSLTPELVALTLRTIEDPGPPPGIEYFDDAEYPAIVEQVLAERPPGDIWIFAFGSLIWKPACEVAEHKLGLVRGWHRAFRLGWDTRWRGNKEHPNLMMGLCRGGQCSGVLYRLPPGKERENLDLLCKREIRIRPPAGRPATQWPRWLRVEAEGGQHRAIAFALNQRGPGYQGKRSHEETAEVLARSCGMAGSGAEYLYNTVAHLAAYGIYDRNLWHLQQLVADRISAYHHAALTAKAHADVGSSEAAPATDRTS